MSKLDCTIPGEGHYLFTGPGQVYLELIDPTRNSRKSYSIELVQDDIGYIIRRSWGRIGRKPQDLEHSHACLTTALMEANSKYREKLRKGYKQSERPTIQFWSQGCLDFHMVERRQGLPGSQTGRSGRRSRMGGFVTGEDMGCGACAD